jgi:DNA-binding GntR family transcriptional regulator
MERMLPGRPQTLTDLVHTWLRDAIVNGVLAPGQRVTEASVAEQLGVSKTPVREGLLRLREIGLLEDDGRRGYRIVRATRSAIDQAYEIRELLEPFTARVAAERADARAVDAITAAARRTRDAVTTGETDEWVHKDADQAFHEEIARVCGNVRIMKAITDAGAVVRATVPGVEDASELLLRSADEHFVVVDAIAAHKPGAAATAMKQHLTRVRAALVEYFDARAAAGE